MALEKTFRELEGLLKQLRDHLRLLQLNVREDLPVEGAVVLVDKLGDAVDDALGFLEEAITAAADARSALTSPRRFDVVARSLTRCQEQFHRLELRFYSELVSYERLTDLNAFANSRSGEWRAWVESVCDGLDRCKPPMEEVSKGLLDCWGEIAEHVDAAAGSNAGRGFSKDAISLEAPLSRTAASGAA